jgi:hypothetical protein
MTRVELIKTNKQTNKPGGQIETSWIETEQSRLRVLTGKLKTEVEPTSMALRFKNENHQMIKKAQHNTCPRL